MYGLRASDYDCPEAGGKKHQRAAEKYLKSLYFYDKIDRCDILLNSLFPVMAGGQRP
jgi:hypothetical protein